MKHPTRKLKQARGIYRIVGLRRCSSKEEGTWMHPCPITGRLISAARALVGVSQTELAEGSGIPLTSLAQMEAEGSAMIASGSDADAVRRALEGFGAVFIAEGDGFGAGVRLKFRRDDARQISRLETEGGIVGNDDVP